jgi:hypothetical protein
MIQQLRAFAEILARIAKNSRYEKDKDSPFSNQSNFFSPIAIGISEVQCCQSNCKNPIAV